MGRFDEALEFYSLTEYADRVHACEEQLEGKWDAFEAVVDKMCNSDYATVYPRLWGTPKNELFGCAVPDFTTNLVLLAGMETHKKELDDKKFDEEQRAISIMRVGKAFRFDLARIGETSVSQLIWGYHFIRARIVEAGRLQYECTNEHTINMHIPRGGKMEKDDVAWSIRHGVPLAVKTYGLTDFVVRCNSWLLSPEVRRVVPEEGNIASFSDRFVSEPGPDCRHDILSFVFNDPDHGDDLSDLPEDTFLRREMKRRLMRGEVFHLGLGVLKEENYR